MFHVEHYIRSYLCLIKEEAAHPLAVNVILKTGMLEELDCEDVL